MDLANIQIFFIDVECVLCYRSVRHFVYVNNFIKSYYLKGIIFFCYTLTIMIWIHISTFS